MSDVRRAGADAPYDLRPTQAAWTHIALRVADIDASIAWYERVHAARAARPAPGRHGLRGVARSARLRRQAVHPRAGPVPPRRPTRSADYPKEVLAPFAHIGDRAARAGRHRRHRRPRPRPPGAWRCRRSSMPDPDRLRLHAARSRREHGRVLLRPGRVRQGQEVWGGGDAARSRAPPAAAPGLPRVVRRAAIPTHRRLREPTGSSTTTPSALGQRLRGPRRVPRGGCPASSPRFPGPALRRRAGDRRRDRGRRRLPADGHERRPPGRGPRRDGVRRRRRPDRPPHRLLGLPQLPPPDRRRAAGD